MESGEGPKAAELDQPLVITLPTSTEQRGVLSALTAYVPKYGEKEGKITPRGEIAKGLFSQLTHQLDEEKPEKDIALTITTKDEKSVLKSALLLMAQENTAKIIHGEIKENSEEHDAQLGAVRQYLGQLTEGDPLFTDTYKLLTGVVKDIDDIKLKAIMTSTDPKEQGLKLYAAHFLQQREVVSDK